MKVFDLAKNLSPTARTAVLGPETMQHIRELCVNSTEQADAITGLHILVENDPDMRQARAMVLSAESGRPVLSEDAEGAIHEVSIPTKLSNSWRFSHADSIKRSGDAGVA